MRNTGTCTWTSNYALVLASGDRLGAAPTIPLPGPVAPDSTVEISVAMTAPAGMGTYEGHWLLRNAAGGFFYVSESADGTLSVRIAVQTTLTTPSVSPVTPTVSPSPSIVPTPGPTPVITDWRGEYFANINLEGSPALVRNDTEINFNWGFGAPAEGLPADHFSVRWTRELHFEKGLCRFHAIVDDGVRLWVDDTLLLDSWRDGAQREVQAEIILPAGNHTVRVEYYERGRSAVIKVWWRQPDLYPDWKGEYWDNPDLSGNPVLVQNEGSIDFDWGRGSAAGGLPVDNFSARWTRLAIFDEGTYRFHILVDDGARMWVDDQLIIDSWQDGALREVTVERAMSSGEHLLRVEYYERGGDAQVRVWWEKIP